LKRAWPNVLHTTSFLTNMSDKAKHLVEEWYQHITKGIF
jgi:hypothetical protein